MHHKALPCQRAALKLAAINAINYSNKFPKPIMQEARTPLAASLENTTHHAEVAIPMMHNSRSFKPPPRMPNAEYKAASRSHPLGHGG